MLRKYFLITLTPVSFLSRYYAEIIANCDSKLTDQNYSISFITFATVVFELGILSQNYTEF